MTMKANVLAAIVVGSEINGTKNVINVGFAIVHLDQVRKINTKDIMRDWEEENNMGLKIFAVVASCLGLALLAWIAFYVVIIGGLMIRLSGHSI